MEKAFDCVDRNLLLYKLLSLGVGGKMYNCLKSIYRNCKHGVNVNGYYRFFLKCIGVIFRLMQNGR